MALLTEWENDDLTPFTLVHSSKEAYELCIACLGGKYDVLVNNSSFLGFPTYRIIVRGLSIVTTGIEEYQIYNCSIGAVSRMSAQISRRWTFQLTDLINLATIRDNMRYQYFSVYDLMGIVLKQTSSTIALDEHLAMLYSFHKQYATSYQYLKDKKGIQEIRSQIIYAKICGWNDQKIDNLLRLFEANYNLNEIFYAGEMDGLKQFPRCPDCMACA